jgi:predicted TIM-barrel fold metal-dependent hydrolase
MRSRSFYPSVDPDKSLLAAGIHPGASHMAHRNKYKAGPDPLQERSDWQARRQEEVIDPNQPIIDPHHHVWDRDSRYLLDELLDDLDSGHDVRSSVFLQCNSMTRAHGDENYRQVGETEFVNGLAAMAASGTYGPIRACEGIVGFADLRLGAPVEAILERHLQTAPDRFRGVRHSSGWDEDPAVRKVIRMPVPRQVLAEPKFREGFAKLAPLGLTFDAWLYFHQLDDVVDLARAHPETTIVVDHVGGLLGIGRYAQDRAAVFAEWRKMIGRIAACPNVTIKLGGLGMVSCGFGFNEKPMPPSSEELAAAWKPYIETCIAAFGPDRAMFESNFPVDKETCSYRVIWNTFKRLAAGYSADEKAALFHRTAARVYRLQPV